MIFGIRAVGVRCYVGNLRLLSGPLVVTIFPTSHVPHPSCFGGTEISETQKTTLLILLTMAVSLPLVVQPELPAFVEAAAGPAGTPTIRKVDISNDGTQMLIYGRNSCRNLVVQLSTIKQV